MRKSVECKKCRRVGTKLFLKGEKCESQKCPMIKKPYPPGQKPKRRKGHVSQYGKELVEKQKLRYWYDLQEKQFARYVTSVINKQSKAEPAGDQLLRKLEGRLDNMVYRSGLASSRSQAKQMINHGFFHINEKPVDRPSYRVKVGDVISVRPGKKKKLIFEEFSTKMKNFTPPSWISLNLEKMEAKIIGETVIEEITPPVEISSIFEFYSR
jgi:small subunit ribosomal protein S4